MKRSLQFAVRFVIAVAVTGMILSALGTSSPARSPYAPALSGFAADQAYAAAYCNNKACIGGSRFNISCGNLANYHCAKYGRNLCSNGPC